jgi:glycine C-acetyltransferase
MPFDRLEQALQAELTALDAAGSRKRDEAVIGQVVPPEGDRGPRILLQGEGERPFLRMNGNGYLGLASHPDVVAAEENATRRYGASPGAVRFISGTFAPHVALEKRLAAFHGRDAAMIYSSAYAAVMGVLPPLVDENTAVISDELNHSCIISAMRLAQPADRHVYGHLDMSGLEEALEAAVGETRQRAIVVTDGIFSMRGDHAPLDEVVELARRFDHHFDENVVVMVDDSHGIGAFGETGRGTEENTGAQADVLVATLGKALGVNGGYVVGSRGLVEFLREKSAFYVYSNPITPGEAAAATKSIDILDSDEGRARLAHLRALTRRLEQGLGSLGYETIPGDHPIVPLLVRDGARTRDIVRRLHGAGILATGLAYPVVPRGEDEIRFQLSAEHTRADIDEVLAVLAKISRG